MDVDKTLERIVLCGGDNCHACNIAKQKLEEAGIKYEYINVSEPGGTDKALRALGFMIQSIPALYDRKTEELILGYMPSKYNKLIRKLTEEEK